MEMLSDESYRQWREIQALRETGDPATQREELQKKTNEYLETEKQLQAAKQEENSREVNPYLRDSDSVYRYEYEGALGGRNFWSTVLTISMGLMAGSLLFKGKDALRLAGDVEAARRATNATMNVHSPVHELDKRILDVITPHVEAQAGRVAEKMQANSEASPRIKNFYKRVFGDGYPPSGNVLIRLFKYYAYQEIMSQRLNPLPVKHTKVDETELMIKTYALLAVAARSGDLFNVVKSDWRGNFGEALDKGILAEIEVIKPDVEKGIGKLKELFQTQLEIENNIKLSEQLLAKAALADADKRDDIARVEQLIERYEAQKSFTQKELKRSTEKLNVAQKDLDIFRSYSQDLLDYLEAVETMKDAGELPNPIPTDTTTDSRQDIASLPPGATTPFGVPLDFQRIQQSEVEREER